jgi:hypothetical protein
MLFIFCLGCILHHNCSHWSRRPALKNGHASWMAMIRTIYTDAKGLLDVLKTYGRVTPADEQDLIRAAAAAVFHDLGITIADSREERDQVLAQIPEQLLVRAIKVEGGWILLHARIEGL